MMYGLVIRKAMAAESPTTINPFARRNGDFHDSSSIGAYIATITTAPLYFADAVSPARTPAMICGFKSQRLSRTTDRTEYHIAVMANPARGIFTVRA